GALLVGCGEVQEAQQELSNAIDQGREQLEQGQQQIDKATTCAEALGIVGFFESVGNAVSNPEETAQQARERAEELATLAAETTDEDVANALREMSDSAANLAENGVGSDTVETVENQVQVLRDACL
ncbi:hypothetical protein, partial [Actinoalloteichus caeruleus]